ncbi:Rab geranylgeranyltransferase [Rhizina undulata]
MTSHGITRSEYAQQSRDEHAKEKERKKLREYNELVETVQKKREENEFSHECLLLTSQLLKLNPEFYTIWNYRRQILQKTLLKPYTPPLPPPEDATEPESAAASPELDPAAVNAGLKAAYETKLALHLKEELTFLLPLLQSFPKCYWIWNHRLWALHQSSELLEYERSKEFWAKELELVAMMLRRDARNFHGWMYRRVVVAGIEGEGNRDGLVPEEFEYTTKTVKGVGGMSNYSAWHNRSKLIPRMLAGRGYGKQERMDFLEDELELLQRNIFTNPHDQSLWFYHRWLIHANTVSPSSAEAIAPGLSKSVKILLLSSEIDSIKELLEDNRECKYIYKALITYVMFLRKLRREPKGETEDGDDEEEEEEVVDEEKEKAEMAEWLARLREIDPLREGRWRDLEKELENV